MPSSPKIKINPSEIWDDANRRKAIRTYTEEPVFDFTQEEFNKCRFEMVNQNLRMVECTIHSGRFSHGYRIHPPHLWDIRKGILYKKVKRKFVKWVPNFSTNLTRLDQAKNEID